MTKTDLFSSKTLTAAVTALALSTQAITFASNASAHDRRNYDDGYGYGYSYGYARRDFGPRDFGRRDRDFDRHGDRYYVEKRKKDHTGRNIAIGLGAVMLGAILASEASRR